MGVLLLVEAVETEEAVAIEDKLAYVSEAVLALVAVVSLLIHSCELMVYVIDYFQSKDSI